MAEAEAIDNKAPEEMEMVWSPEHIPKLGMFIKIADWHKSQGKMADAEKLYMFALEGKKKLLGPEHRSTLDTAYNLGIFYTEQRRMAEAEAMLQQALEGKEKAWGPDHKSTLETVYNLGLVYAIQGKMAEAEVMYKQALEGSIKTQGPEHPWTLFMVNCLGNLYGEQGKLEQAEVMHRWNVRGRLKTFGRLHPSTLQAVNSLRKASLSNCRENSTRKKDVSNSIMDLIYLSNDWGTLRLDLSQEWGTLSHHLFGALGRALICSADDFSAEIAFSYQILLIENNWTYHCICDGCGRTLNPLIGRFVCKSCEDGDVCRDCFDQIKKKRRVITSCVRHSFLKVTPLFLSDSKAGVEMGHNLLSMTRQSWFEGLRVKYQSASQNAEAFIAKTASPSLSISSTSLSSTSLSSTAPSSDNTTVGRYRGKLKRPRRRIRATPKGIEELKLLPSSAPELVCEVCQRIFSVLFRQAEQATSGHPQAREVSDESGSIKLFSEYVPSPPAGHKHQPSFAALKQSAASCIICRLLFNGFVTRGFGKDIETDLNSTHTTKISFKDHSEAGMPKRVCGFSLENSGGRGLLMPSLVIYAKIDQIPDLPLWQNSEGVHFDDTLPAIKNWLENCTSSHPECALASGSEPPALPTRVIDVGAFDGSTEPRLYVSNGQRAQYIALSHCWGQCSTLRTISKTLPEMLEKISMESLPRSFQDAVLVTRKLHVRYLWIDSICIVQDDSIDWDRESVKMDSVYQNAYVTIAATAAPNSKAGFLYPRLPALRVRFNDLSKRSQSDSEKNTVGNEIAYVRLDTSDEVSVQDGPLNQRAWVLQEDVLSRRTLHFAKDQLFWICKREAISEEGTPVRVLSKSLGRALWGSGSLDINKRRDIWWQIIEEYSSREITKKSDKFAALAGITSVIEERFKGKTFAGVNLNDLHYDLFWDVEQDTDNPPLEQIPSWSWASLDGQVRKPYLKAPFSEQMEILDATKLTWSGKALLSWTAGGALKVRGPLMKTKCTLGKDTLRDILEPPQRMMSIYAAALHDLSYLAEYISQNWAEYLRQKISLQRSLGKFTFDRRGSVVEDDIWCLEVARGPPSEFRIVRPQHVHLEKRENISWSHILILKRMNSKTMTTTTTMLSSLLHLFYFVVSWKMLRLGRFEDDAGEFRRLGIGYIEVEDGKFDEKSKSFVRKTLTLI